MGERIDRREKARRLLALGGTACSYSSSRDTLTKIIRKTATIPIPVMVSSGASRFTRSVRALLLLQTIRFAPLRGFASPSG
jgi:hypothetical protein